MMNEPARGSDIKPAPRHQWLREELWYGVIVIVAILVAWLIGANYQPSDVSGPPVGQVPDVKPPAQRS